MKRIVVAAVLATLAWAAQAQTYLSINVTNAKAEANQPFTSAAGDSGTFADLALGYRWSNHFAVEAATFSPDTVKNLELATRPAVFQQDFLHRVWSIKGYRLSALGTIPVSEKFALLGRISAYHLKAKLAGTSQSVLDDGDLLTPVIVTSSAFGSSTTELVPGYGLGIEWTPIRQVSVRLSVERVKLKAGMFGAGNDLEHLSTTTFELLHQF